MNDQHKNSPDSSDHGPFDPAMFKYHHLVRQLVQEHVLANQEIVQQVREGRDLTIEDLGDPAAVAEIPALVLSFQLAKYTFLLQNPSAHRPNVQSSPPADKPTHDPDHPTDV